LANREQEFLGDGFFCSVVADPAVHILSATLPTTATTKNATIFFLCDATLKMHQLNRYVDLLCK
jgi:hypothetical protein